MDCLEKTFNEKFSKPLCSSQVPPFLCMWHVCCPQIQRKAHSMWLRCDNNQDVCGAQSCLWGHREVSVLVRVSLPGGCPIRGPAAAIPVFWGQIARSLLDREASLTFQVAFLNAICVRHVNYPNTVPDFVHFFCFSPFLGRVEIPNDATWLQPPFLAPYFPPKMPL